MVVKISCLFFILILLRKVLVYSVHYVQAYSFFNIHNSFEKGLFFRTIFNILKCTMGPYFFTYFQKRYIKVLLSSF